MTRSLTLGTLGARGLGQMLADDLPDPGLARVADELHSQYLLGFAPPKRDDKSHALDVRLTKKGLKPRARTSYVAPKG